MAKSLPLWILTEDSRTKSNPFRVHHSHNKVFTEQFVTPSSTNRVVPSEATGTFPLSSTHLRVSERSLASSPALLFHEHLM